MFSERYVFILAKIAHIVCAIDECKHLLTEGPNTCSDGVFLSNIILNQLKNYQGPSQSINKRSVSANELHTGVTYDFTIIYEGREEILKKLNDLHPEIKSHKRFQKRYSNILDPLKRFVPFKGPFPLCQIKNNHSINSALQFLLTSEHFMAFKANQKHKDFIFLQYMKQVHDLKNIIGDSEGGATNNTGSYIQFVQANTTLIQSIFESLQCSKPSLYSDETCIYPTDIFKKLFLYHLKCNYEIKTEMFYTKLAYGLFCNTCKVLYQTRHPFYMPLFFRFNNYGKLSIEEQVKSWSLDKNNLIDMYNRTLYCRIRHKLSKITLKLLSAPSIFIFTAEYQKKNRMEDTSSKALIVDQTINIHGRKYSLKAAILQHMKPCGGCFYSVLSLNNGEWHHSLDNFGRKVHDIGAVLNKNSDLLYLLYELPIQQQCSKKT